MILTWDEGFHHFHSVHQDFSARPRAQQLRKNRKPREALLIGCMDFTWPSDFTPDDVEAVYAKYLDVRAQNLNRSALTAAQSARTVALPIGVDFHSLDHPRGASRLDESAGQPWHGQMERLADLRLRSAPLERRIPKILVTWSPTSDSSARHVRAPGSPYVSRAALHAQAVAASEVADVFLGPREDVWRRMSEYQFVFSPIGNGLDCRRVWEALALGCIVVVQDNPAAREFAHLFPLVFARDLRSITPSDLARWGTQAGYCAASLESLALSNWLGPNVDRLRPPPASPHPTPARTAAGGGAVAGQSHRSSSGGGDISSNTGASSARGAGPTWVAGSRPPCSAEFRLNRTSAMDRDDPDAWAWADARPNPLLPQVIVHGSSRSRRRWR